jgi:hypothetical protein
MAAKLTRLTRKIVIQLHLVAESCIPFAVLAPGGQSGKFWIQPRIMGAEVPGSAISDSDTLVVSTTFNFSVGLFLRYTLNCNGEVMREIYVDVSLGATNMQRES